MSAFTILASILIPVFLIWAIWFVIRLIQYVGSGEYEIDQRLRNIGK